MRRGWILCLCIAGCSVTGCKEPVASVAVADTTHTPSEVLKDFTMHDVRSSITTMSLKAKEGRIYASEHYADVDEPRLFFYKQGKESSRLIAPEGRIQTETREVECWGGVTVISADSSTLTTERLRYDPKVQKIFSNEAVHLDKPDSITDGIGLETDPELKTVKIGKQKVHFKKGVS